MKLISCHIENFGNLQDVSLSFEEGLNVICRENGWGKSTLAAFLRAMFYGLEGSRKRELTENERKRYRPWQGGVFGGQLRFAAGGKIYQMVRTFGAKDSEDTFQLYDGETNLASADYTKNIGEELFHINRESFLRTIFIGQNDCTVEVTDDINAKMGRISNEPGDLNCFDAAVSALTKEINRLHPGRATGSVKKREAEIYAAERKIAEAASLPEQLRLANRQTEEIQHRRDTLKQQRTALAQQQNENARLQAMAGKAREWERFKQQKAAAEAALAELSGSDANGCPQEEALSAQLQQCEALTKAEQQMQIYHLNPEETEEWNHLMQFFAETGVPQQSEIQQRIQREESYQKEMQKAAAGRVYSQENAEKYRKINYILLALGILLLLGGCVGAAVVSLKCLIASAAGVVLLLLSLRKKTAVSEQPVPEEGDTLAALQQIHDEQAAFLQAFPMEFHSENLLEPLLILKHFLLRRKELEEKQRKFLQAVEGYKSVREQLQKFLEAYGTPSREPYLQQLNEIQKHFMAIRLQEKAVETANRELQHFEQENDCAALAQAAEALFSRPDNNTEAEPISARLLDLNEEIEYTQQELLQQTAQLEALQEQLDNLAEMRAEQEARKALQEKETERYRYFVLAKEKLTEAKERMTARYTTPLLSKFRNYYGQISGAASVDAEQFRMNANTELSVEAFGRQREKAALSCGLQDLADFCLRIALADTMYQTEKPMLILDDPFTNLDDEKKAAALRFLQTLSPEFQILYLTCRGDNGHY